jgi:CheY-like chemotaxis protein
MSGPSKHPILVVDDELSIRESLTLLLVSSGYDVSTINDGFAALLHLRQELPDLIVSDLNMSHMSGYELLSVVRRRARNVPAGIDTLLNLRLREAYA